MAEHRVPDETRIDALIEGGAAALGIDIPAEARPGVARNLSLTAEMAARLMDQDLDTDDLPAETFTPIAPHRGGEGS